MLQKSENLKYHPIDYSTGVIIVVDNNYNFHKYLDNESVSFIIFAFFDVFFINLNMIREVRLLSYRFKKKTKRSTTILNSGFDCKIKNKKSSLVHELLSQIEFLSWFRKFVSSVFISGSGSVRI